MAEAIEAAADLAAITACLIAIGLLYLAVILVAPIAAALDFSIPHTSIRPLHFLSTALDVLLVQQSTKAIKALEKMMTGLFYGLIASLALIIGAPLALGLGVKEALAYMWGHLLVPKIRSVTNAIATDARKAINTVTGLAATVARNVTQAEAYAQAQATRAIHTAETYADHASAEAYRDAVRYADSTAAAVRHAEDAAINRLGTLTTAAIASAEAGFADALGGLGGLVAGTEAELDQLLRDLKEAGGLGLLAAIPALALLVQTLATETGLENAECRQKIKGVCGTDPLAWGRLLGELALVAGALDFGELVKVARVAIKPTAALLRQVA